MELGLAHFKLAEPREYRVIEAHESRENLQQKAHLHLHLMHGKEVGRL